MYVYIIIKQYNVKIADLCKTVEFGF